MIAVLRNIEKNNSRNAAEKLHWKQKDCGGGETYTEKDGFKGRR